MGQFIFYHWLIKIAKEVHTMKATFVYQRNFANRPHAPYPNAATNQEILHKLLDLLLVAALGVGAAAILLLLVAIC